MHDDCIVGYSVNLEEKSMVIQTTNNNEKTDLLFRGFDTLLQMHY